MRTSEGTDQMQAQAKKPPLGDIQRIRDFVKGVTASIDRTIRCNARSTKEGWQSYVE